MSPSDQSDSGRKERRVRVIARFLGMACLRSPDRPTSEAWGCAFCDLRPLYVPGPALVCELIPLFL